MSIELKTASGGSVTLTPADRVSNDTVTFPAGGGTAVYSETANTFTGAITANAGIYLGGAVAANLLDDYEEGTFTATITDGTETLVNATCYYVKVGSVVHVEMVFQNLESSARNFTTTTYITGLPFTVSKTAPIASFINYTASGNTFAARVSAESTEVRLYRENGAIQDQVQFTAGDINAFTDVYVQGTYLTSL